jgi:hypothetical protein
VNSIIWRETENRDQNRQISRIARLNLRRLPNLPNRAVHCMMNIDVAMRRQKPASLSAQRARGQCECCGGFMRMVAGFARIRTERRCPSEISRFQLRRGVAGFVRIRTERRCPSEILRFQLRGIRVRKNHRPRQSKKPLTRQSERRLLRRGSSELKSPGRSYQRDPALWRPTDTNRLRVRFLNQ